MAIENKQEGIAQELARRIQEETYADKLPNGQEIADEFGGNAKTANKGIIK